MKILSLSIPGYGHVEAPPNIPNEANSAPNAINAFIALFLVAGIVFAVIFASYGGVMWIMSQGDKTKLDRARRTVLFSIIGLIVMLLAFTIVQAIGTVLGSDYISKLGQQ